MKFYCQIVCFMFDSDTKFGTNSSNSGNCLSWWTSRFFLEPCLVLATYLHTGTHCLNMASSKFFFFQDMAIYLFLNLKNPFVGFTSSFFFGRQVTKVRPKKKEKNTGWNLLSKHGDITIFFPGNLATFKPIFHKNALYYESHWICLWSPSDKN